MRLAEATSLFLALLTNRASSANEHIKYEIKAQSLRLLASYYSSDVALDDITPTNLRDFLSRWYVERTYGSRSVDSISAKPDESITSPNPTPQATDYVPGPLDLLDSIGEFAVWTDQQTDSTRAARLLPVLNELRRSLPRALAITNALTKALRNRGGAFSFPEFLTSFEEGGNSQYDIDVPGNVGAIDGYFRVVRLEGSLVEAEELISEERLWPIAIPSEIAALLDVDYILNLELVRKAQGWQIAGCGFVYPPGTEIG